MTKYRLLSPLLVGDSLPKTEPEPCHRDLITGVLASREIELDPKIVMMGGSPMEGELSLEEWVSALEVSEEIEPVIISPRLDHRAMLDPIHHNPRLAIIGVGPSREAEIIKSLGDDFKITDIMADRSILDGLDGILADGIKPPMFTFDSCPQLEDYSTTQRGRGTNIMHIGNHYEDMPAPDAMFEDRNILQDPITNSLKKMRGAIDKTVSKNRKKNKLAKQSRRQNRG